MVEHYAPHYKGRQPSLSFFPSPTQLRPCQSDPGEKLWSQAEVQDSRTSEFSKYQQKHWCTPQSNPLTALVVVNGPMFQRKRKGVGKTEATDIHEVGENSSGPVGDQQKPRCTGTLLQLFLNASSLDLIWWYCRLLSHRRKCYHIAHILKLLWCFCIHSQVPFKIAFLVFKEME